MCDKIEKTVIREQIEWISIRWHNDPDKKMKRVLLVGDSIVVGHGTRVHELLKEEMCVDYFATAKNITDIEFMNELEFMLQRRNYELILFNNGLHGFNIEDDLYEPALREVFSILKNKTPHLAWRTSTPMLNKENMEEFNPDRTPRVIRRNNDAAKLAKELDLPILDLYTPMSENKQFFNHDAVHYTEEGQQVQAVLVADFIREKL